MNWRTPLMFAVGWSVGDLIWGDLSYDTPLVWFICIGITVVLWIQRRRNEI